MSAQKTYRLLIQLCLCALLLAACVEETPPGTIEQGTAEPTPSAEAATPTQPTQAAIKLTAAPIKYIAYQHRSTVFALSIPDDWEILDGSTDLRLSLRLIPPPGIGSRFSLEITNEGVLTLEEIHQRAESTIHVNYDNNPAYQETGRGELPDGRFQVVFAYDDGRGVAGEEKLTAWLIGPFLVITRVFSSSSDPANVLAALDTITGSLTVDPEAPWGASVAAISPAELLLINTSVWQRGELTNFMGELYNVSPAAISEISIKASFCDSDGIVLVQLEGSTGIKVVPSGSAAPFLIAAPNLPRSAQVCGQQISARPAQPDPVYTTDLNVDVKPGVNARGQVTMQGQITNPSLSPVKNIHLVIVIYDADGKVIGYGVADSEPDFQLLPGQSMPVSVTFQSLGGKQDRFIALVEAEIVVPGSSSLSP